MQSTYGAADFSGRKGMRAWAYKTYVRDNLTQHHAKYACRRRVRLRFGIGIAVRICRQRLYDSTFCAKKQFFQRRQKRARPFLQRRSAADRGAKGAISACFRGKKAVLGGWMWKGINRKDICKIYFIKFLQKIFKIGIDKEKWLCYTIMELHA